mmetsp:Transcript_48000/g.102812  ORF Transcript_48000/g.102812 Transcript_48000/m.102812 type:complete len:97 (+) Transcript_48000:133-423(+)
MGLYQHISAKTGYIRLSAGLRIQASSLRLPLYSCRDSSILQSSESPDLLENLKFDACASPGGTPGGASAHPTASIEAPPHRLPLLLRLELRLMEGP